MDIRPGEWYGEVYTEVELSRRDFASSIRRTPYHLPYLLFAKEPATPNPLSAEFT
jgi:hypothetical protein